MHRRMLLAAAGAVPLTLSPLAVAAGGGHVEYSRERFDAALADGMPFMLDFYAPW